MEADRYTDSRLLTASEAHMRVVRADLRKIDQVALDEALKFIMDEVERRSDMGVLVLTFVLVSDGEKREYAPIYAIVGEARPERSNARCMILGIRPMSG